MQHKLCVEITDEKVQAHVSNQKWKSYHTFTRTTKQFSFIIFQCSKKDDKTKETEGRYKIT